MFKMDLIPKGKGIVPGCGRGYAPRALSYGGRHCIGLDIAPTAVAAAKEYLKSNPPSDTNSKVEFKHGSFFEYKITMVIIVLILRMIIHFYVHCNQT